ncbi:MAG: SAM-dependent methyltransferase, partial [bacterium]|nr:SAM-dependent methyltransferase [bacterium]
IRFCQKHPQLKAAVFDLPATRSFAEGNFAKHGLADRIEFIEGNFNNDAIPGQYDAIWMSHILHGEGDDACAGMIKKAVAALAPGGKIIIHEFILENNRTEPLFPALFSLNMFLHTAKGKSYTEKELSAMLAAEGITEIQRIKVQTPTDSGLIWGVKESA